MEDMLKERRDRLAREIYARRRGVVAGIRGPVAHRVTKTQREMEGARINGMVIALTFMLGRPNDLPAAEAYIDQLAR